MTSYQLSGRKALVTGGARGLGAGMAQALAAAGAAVLIGDVLEDEGKQTAQALRDSGAKAEFVPLDVTDDASWASAVNTAVEAIGGLDILVNNAGVEITSLITELETADIRKMLDVNVLGTALGMKHGLRAMRPGGAAGTGGSIISVASTTTDCWMRGTSITRPDYSNRKGSKYSRFTNSKPIPTRA